MVWNVRGLNNTNKQAKVRAMIVSHNIRMFSLLETRVKARFGKMYLSVCPNWCFYSNHAHHQNGRIIVAWMPNSFSVNILYSSAQLVHCEVHVPNSQKEFSLTFIYGVNDAKGREEL